jgi:uncharacterized membrane protein
MTDAAKSRSDAARRPPRWMLLALLVSLALNLIVVGSVAGAMWRAHRPPVWAGSVIPNLLGYASTLPMERRKQLWAQTVEERQHLRPFRREVRAAREATIKVLVTEPFDPQQYQAAQARQAEAESHARQAVQALYSKLAQSLTPEERHAFPRWREHRRAPTPNLLDEPDQQAGEPTPR